MPPQLLVGIETCFLPLVQYLIGIGQGQMGVVFLLLGAGIRLSVDLIKTL